MIYHFETTDNETFVIDTATMKWGRASSILSAPSIQAAENNLAKYEFSESGDLISMGAGTYNMDGRTPRTEGPGAGLCTIGILCVPFEDTLVVYLRANVKIKDDTFKSNPIKNVKYLIMQEKPEPEAPAVAIAQE
jgi:hypothetical protein